MMQGTPYVYQGEELGMTNFHFTEVEQCDDIEEKNIYKDLVINAPIYTHEQMMEIISRKGRDNARTPMQWDDSANGGFTTGTPWLAVNPNYTFINAASQVNDPESIFSYYKQLIRLRKENDIIVYGKYELLEADHEDLFIYTRTLDDKKLLVICNFTDKEVALPEAIAAQTAANKGVLVSNYKENASMLKPYEAVVYWV